MPARLAGEGRRGPLASRGDEPLAWAVRCAPGPFVVFSDAGTARILSAMVIHIVIGAYAAHGNARVVAMGRRMP
jgi:hypothetical protein